MREPFRCILDEEDITIEFFSSEEVCLDHVRKHVVRDKLRVVPSGDAPDIREGNPNVAKENILKRLHHRRPKLDSFPCLEAEDPGREADGPQRCSKCAWDLLPECRVALDPLVPAYYEAIAERLGELIEENRCKLGCHGHIVATEAVHLVGHDGLFISILPRQDEDKHYVLMTAHYRAALEPSHEPDPLQESLMKALNMKESGRAPLLRYWALHEWVRKNNEFRFHCAC